MRNYWFKILLGALGIFAVGMIGVAIAGERLGKLDHVTLYRESPDQVSEVELTVNLADSLLAQGLSGCRLVADIEGENRESGVNIRVGKDSTDQNAFACLTGDSTPPDFEEFGTAIFNPGEVEVPLLLPVSLVAELQSLDFDHEPAGADSLGQINVPGDSIAAKVEREIDSAMLGRRPGESRRAATRRFADSIRAEAMKRLAEESDPQ